jgi:hypothetical protein
MSPLLFLAGKEAQRGRIHGKRGRGAAIGGKGMDTRGRDSRWRGGAAWHLCRAMPREYRVRWCRHLYRAMPREYRVHGVGSTISKLLDDNFTGLFFYYLIRDTEAVGDAKYARNSREWFCVSLTSAPRVSDGVVGKAAIFLGPV